VRLNKGNRLLLGERVAISLQRPKSLQERVAPLLRGAMESVLGVRKAVAMCDADPAGSDSPAGCQGLALPFTHKLSSIYTPAQQVPGT
jgi:hypothetical protein